MSSQYWIQHPSANPDSPFTLTHEQVKEYLLRTGFITPDVTEADTAKFAPTLPNLVRIVRDHLIAFPFENTLMHYSPEHEIDIKPRTIFKRFVQTNRGGTWCFGHNSFLMAVLREMGYRVYPGAGRVNRSIMPDKPPSYTALSHMVLFVQPLVDYDAAGHWIADRRSLRSNRTYLVDVGFGSGGLAYPIPLVGGSEEEEKSLGWPGASRFERHRLRRGDGGGENTKTSLALGPDGSGLDDATIHQNNRHWTLQRLVQKIDGAPSEWRTLYTFSETEFHLQDYISASLALSHERDTIFWNNTMAVRHVVSEDRDGDHDLVGGEGNDNEEVRRLTGGDGRALDRLIFFANELKKDVGGRTVSLKKVTTERERLEVLREEFGIVYEDVRMAMECIKEGGRTLWLGD